MGQLTAMRLFTDDEKHDWKVSAFKRVHSGSRRRGIPFELELDNILTPDHCVMFDTPLVYVPAPHGVKIPRANVPALCRINHQFGYVEWNVVTLSHLANSWQHSSTLTLELLEQCRHSWEVLAPVVEYWGADVSPEWLDGRLGEPCWG
jgi:hypothetical protein